MKTRIRVFLSVMFALLLSSSIMLVIYLNPYPSKTVVLFFDDGWENQYSVAYPILKMYGFSATFGIITNRIGEGSGTTWSRMTREQIQILSSDMEIASHSHSHPSLISLNNYTYPMTYEDILRYELQTSKEILEEIIGKEVKTFIIPYDESDMFINNQILEVYDNLRPTDKLTWIRQFGFLDKTLWIHEESVEEFSKMVNYELSFIAYHHIKECFDTENSNYTTSPNTFHAHMKYLHDNNYRVISYEEWLRI